MNIEKFKEPIELNIHYGEDKAYDKNALKAYKCEKEMRRAVQENKNMVKYALYNKYQIPFNYEVKVSEPGDPIITEKFSIIELINDKLAFINSSVCLSTYEVYKEKGIVEAVCKLHEFSNLTII